MTMPRGGAISAALFGCLRAWCAAALLVLAVGPALALDPLPTPAGPVVLTVSGNVAVTNSDQGAQFDQAMLDALGVTEVRTSTAWTDGTQIFEGVLLRSVLERVGATGTTITGIALNDYVAPIPVEDATLYNVILASKMNGEVLTVRDRGPLFVVYPRDDYPELQEPHRNDRWVWQLRELNVQ
jgi:hypothetical protein